MQILQWLPRKRLRLNSQNRKVWIDGPVWEWILFSILAGMLGTFLISLLTAIFSPSVGVWMLSLSPAVGIGLAFLTNHLAYVEARNLNRNRRPPHEVIDGFVRWEQGDRIDIAHYRSSLYYVRTTDSYHVIVAERERPIFGEDKTEYKNLAALPPLYLSKYLEENRTLQRRLKKEVDVELGSGESEYDKFLKQFKKEFKKLDA